MQKLDFDNFLAICWAPRPEGFHLTSLFFTSLSSPESQDFSKDLIIFCYAEFCSGCFKEINCRAESSIYFFQVQNLSMLWRLCSIVWTLIESLQNTYVPNTYQWDCWETVGDSILAQHICHKHVYWHTRLGWKETILGNSFFSGAKLRLELKYFLDFHATEFGIRHYAFMGTNHLLLWVQTMSQNPLLYSLSRAASITTDKYHGNHI